MNQGETFDVISNDLTTGGKKGNVPYGTLTAISESPFQFGLIYTGSDDGYINITQNSGGSWTRISNTLPQGLWVSRVVASQHKKERVYATLNGYRNDDFKPYIYMSNDLGNTWNSINSNLPSSPINVVKEDPVDENLLYIGTDNGVYVTFNKGLSWEAFSNGLTTVAVHDLVIQPEARDLVVGTHGRSIYKANIAALQQYNKVNSKDIALFEVPSIRFSSRWGSSWNQFSQVFEPSTTITVFVKKSENQSLKVFSEEGLELNSISFNADKGFNYTNYDLSMTEGGKKALQKANPKLTVKKAQNGKYYLPKGKYTIQINDEKTSLTIK